VCVVCVCVCVYVCNSGACVLHTLKVDMRQQLWLLRLFRVVCFTHTQPAVAQIKYLGY